MQHPRINISFGVAKRFPSSLTISVCLSACNVDLKTKQNRLRLYLHLLSKIVKFNIIDYNHIETIPLPRDVKDFYFEWDKEGLESLRGLNNSLPHPLKNLALAPHPRY